jgi:transcriptional regulator with XRE-family HTH domain
MSDAAPGVTPPVPTPQEVGERIRVALADLGKQNPIEWLCVELNRSSSTVRRWLNGESDPSYLDMVRLSELTARPLEYFAGPGAAVTPERIDEHLKRLLREKRLELSKAQRDVERVQRDIESLLTAAGF